MVCRQFLLQPANDDRAEYARGVYYRCLTYYFIHNTTCLYSVLLLGGITSGRPIARIINAGSRSNSISFRKAAMYLEECLKNILYPVQR